TDGGVGSRGGVRARSALGRERSSPGPGALGLGSGSGFVQDLAVDDGHEDSSWEHVQRFDPEYISVEEGQIGTKSGLEDAEAILGERCEGGASGVTAKGLLEAEAVLRVPATGRAALSVLSRDRRVDSPEGIDDFDGEIAAVGQRDARVGEPSPGVSA